MSEWASAEEVRDTVLVLVAIRGLPLFPSAQKAGAHDVGLAQTKSPLMPNSCLQAWRACLDSNVPAESSHYSTLWPTSADLQVSTAS